MGSFKIVVACLSCAELGAAQPKLVCFLFWGWSLKILEEDYLHVSVFVLYFDLLCFLSSLFLDFCDFRSFLFSSFVFVLGLFCCI